MSEKRERLPKRMWRSLFSPRKTFELIQGNDLGSGLLVIAMIALLSAWAGYIYSFKLPIQQIPSIGPNGGFQNPDTFRTNMAILLALGSGLGGVVNWLISSVLIFLTGRLMIGKGSFRKMLALTAFSSMPLVIQQVLRLIDSYSVPEQTLLSMVSASSSTQNPLISQILSVFTVFGIWSFAITLVAVSVNYETSKRRALATTLTAYILFILLRAFTPI